MRGRMDPVKQDADKVGRRSEVYHDNVRRAMKINFPYAKEKFHGKWNDIMKPHSQTGKLFLRAA